MLSKGKLVQNTGSKSVNYFTSRTISWFKKMDSKAYPWDRLMASHMPENISLIDLISAANDN